MENILMMYQTIQGRQIYIEGTINTKGYNKIRHFSLGLGQVDLAVSVYPGMALRVVEEVVA